MCQHAADDQHADLNKSSDKLDIAFMDDLEASLLGKGDSLIQNNLEKPIQTNTIPPPIMKQVF